MYFVKCYCHEDITPTAWSIITIHFEQRRKSTCTCQNIFYNLLIAQLIHLLLLTSFLLTTLQKCLDFEIVILKIHIVHSMQLPLQRLSSITSVTFPQSYNFISPQFCTLEQPENESLNGAFSYTGLCNILPVMPAAFEYPL